ncbi:hypothetical protein FB472_0357 [Rhodoglobus vestalii]|uniref:Uncharacterized protein n=2 Tax=Rhodoglobus vestalii TaxID=193384 RepID=A0A8H2PXI9_9MICO|nr:hypothetical protein FB472_0357 [Rhodoglobus vestalii]
MDLEFSRAKPADPTAVLAGEASPSIDQINGTITAKSLEIEVYPSTPAFFVQSGTMKLKDIRGIAVALCERGLTVSHSGPGGLIAKLRTVRQSVTQRLLTGWAYIELGSRNALAPLLKRPNAKTATTLAKDHHPEDDYVLHSLGDIGGGSRPFSGQDPHQRVRRTRAWMEMGERRAGFFREEYSDHGRAMVVDPAVKWGTKNRSKVVATKPSHRRHRRLDAPPRERNL